MQHRRETTDVLGSALMLLGVTLMWIFFAIWATYGMLPVLLLALFLNHLIDRLDALLE